MRVRCLTIKKEFAAFPAHEMVHADADAANFSYPTSNLYANVVVIKPFKNNLSSVTMVALVSELRKSAPSKRKQKRQLCVCCVYVTSSSRMIVCIKSCGDENSQRPASFKNVSLVILTVSYHSLSELPVTNEC